MAYMHVGACKACANALATGSVTSMTTTIKVTIKCPLDCDMTGRTPETVLEYMTESDECIVCMSELTTVTSTYEVTA